ncbi:MAG TPA: YccF domain-containing protein [Candidatus Coprocola pullicola]|nr:YccF domain-containing protein [Candidatus Coprocola pullicola]
MSLLGNIIWLLLGGLICAIGWCLAGVLCCITIIGIPIGLQCFKFSKLVLSPFGKEIVYGNMSGGSMVLNVFWMIFCGWELAVMSAVAGIICCITIIGIPFGLQHFKFALLALLPFGAEVR